MAVDVPGDTGAVTDVPGGPGAEANIPEAGVGVPIGP